MRTYLDAHIDAAELESVMAEVKLATDWLAEKQQLQSGQAKSDDPVLLSADIAKKEEALKRFAQPILARPKPAPPPPAPEATPESAPEAEPSASEPMDAEGAEEAPKPAADDLD